MIELEHSGRALDVYSGVPAGYWFEQKNLVQRGLAERVLTEMIGPDRNGQLFKPKIGARKEVWQYKSVKLSVGVSLKDPNDDRHNEVSDINIDLKGRGSLHITTDKFGLTESFIWDNYYFSEVDGIYQFAQTADSLPFDHFLYETDIKTGLPLAASFHIQINGTTLVMDYKLGKSSNNFELLHVTELSSKKNIDLDKIPEQYKEPYLIQDILNTILFRMNENNSDEDVGNYQLGVFKLLPRQFLFSDNEGNKTNEIWTTENPHIQAHILQLVLKNGTKSTDSIVLQSTL